MKSYAKVCNSIYIFKTKAKRQITNFFGPTEIIADSFTLFQVPHDRGAENERGGEGEGLIENQTKKP